MKKGERKKEENYTKKGRKGLKYASFWLRPARCKLICQGKNEFKKGGGKIIKMHNIYPWNYLKRCRDKEKGRQRNRQHVKDRKDLKPEGSAERDDEREKDIEVRESVWG